MKRGFPKFRDFWEYPHCVNTLRISYSILGSRADFESISMKLNLADQCNNARLLNCSKIRS